MQKTEVRNIDSHTYEITQYSAGKGLKLLFRLGKILGKPLGLIAESAKSDSKEFISKAAEALFEHMDENLGEQTVRDILETTRCDNKPILFDTHFSGQMGHLFKVVKSVLEVQYGDFFSVLLANVSTAQEAPTSTAQNT